MKTRPVGSSGRSRRSGGAKPIIGIVGGVGAGKSLVAKQLQSLGALVIDADRQVHRELQAPEVVATLRSWWGDRVAADDGGVNRDAIAAIVFDDAAELKRLENLLYPRLAVHREAAIQRAAAVPDIKAVVLDSPKLFEAGLDGECHAVIYVDADEQVRQARVAAARGWPPAELARRENSQISLDWKKAKSDYIVVNNSDTAALRRQVESVLGDILKTFSG